jgi:hypothetical protein
MSAFKRVFDAPWPANPECFPLYPHKPTWEADIIFVRSVPRATKCTVANNALFDHLVGA